MANLLDELVYIELDDARDTSTILAGITDDDELTSLITEAQWIIDTYIGSYWEREVETQTFIFPTVDDWIPQEIKLATVRISEQIFLSGKTLSSLRGDKITSESNLSRSVGFSDKESFSSYVKSIGIPKKALNILDKYKNDFIWQVI